MMQISDEPASDTSAAARNDNAVRGLLLAGAGTRFAAAVAISAALWAGYFWAIGYWAAQ